MQPHTHAARRFRLPLTVLIAFSGMSCPILMAADKDSVDAERNPAELQQVVVTGTHIRSPNIQSISPIEITSAEEIRRTGATNLEAVLRDLPMASPGLSATSDNFANGKTTANLRDLGVNRTLVLIDGRRVVPVDYLGTVDLDILPAAMIDRIDVVTGGASAVYGADAIAGVVNVILKKHFTGLQLNAQVAAYDPGDGRMTDVSLLAGTDYADGRGNVTIFGGVTNRQPIFRRGRSWASPDLISNNTTLVPFGGNIIGAGRDLGRGLMFAPDRTLVPYDGSTLDRSPAQYIVVPQDRISLGLNGDYRAAPGADIYYRAIFAQNRVSRQTSTVAITDTVAVNFGNPLLSDQERSILFTPGPHLPGDTSNITLQKAMLTLGNNGEHNLYQTIDAVLGIRGPLGGHFTYDLAGQFGETTWDQTLYGDVSPTRFQQGLLVDPDGTCTDPVGGCVPIDIFSGAPNAISSAQVAYFGLVQRAASDTRQVVATASISGDLGAIHAKSPWAADPMSVALGSEYRTEQSTYNPDDTLAVGNNLSFGAIPPTAGSYHVKEGYVEAHLPLAQDQTGARDLSLEGGYRISHYDLEGRANTYKLGVNWAPLTDIRLRASYERAIRAPTIGELFEEQQPATATAIDPCFGNGAQGPTASAGLCAATGVPAGAYGNPAFQCPGGQCVSLVGGNRNIEFERSDSKTFGLTLTPRFAPQLSASIDYYDINLKGAIAPFGATVPAILANCYGSAPGQNPTQDPNNIYCRQVARNSAGEIFGGGFLGATSGDVLLLNQNTGFLRVKGIDLQTTYRRDLVDWGLHWIPGSIAANFDANYVTSHSIQQLPSLPVYECAGLFGLTCGQPIPTVRVNSRLTWLAGDRGSLSLRWRYLSGVTRDSDKFSGTATDIPDHRIPAFSYFDLMGTWNALENVTVSLGVNNLFDREPPLLSRSVAVGNIQGLSNTFPATYDIDRQFFVGVSASF